MSMRRAKPGEVAATEQSNPTESTVPGHDDHTRDSLARRRGPCLPRPRKRTGANALTINRSHVQIRRPMAKRRRPSGRSYALFVFLPVRAGRRRPICDDHPAPDSNWIRRR